MDAFTFLRERVALFSAVSDEHLTGLAVVSTLTSYKNGATIMFKGATVDGLHVMCVGRAGVFIKPPTQRSCRWPSSPRATCSARCRSSRWAPPARRSRPSRTR